jgi:hypothetical protein
VYLSYVALGLGAGWAWEQARDRISERSIIALAAASACGLAAVYATHGYLTFQNATEREAGARNEAGSWDSPYTRAVADWMRETIPPGAHVITSRLYFSSLHVETEAQYRIHQLPTVRVDIDPERVPMVEARANLFRWGESDLRPTAAGDTWLHVQQFSGKSYWVGLSQQELFEYIQARRIEYVILTGEDSAFSSNAYAWLLTSHPAFSLLGTIEGTGGDLMFGYTVDRSKLDLVDHPTSISPADFEQLVSSTSLSGDELARRLGTKLRVTDVTGGLSDREREAAHAGTAIDGE